MKYIKAFFYGLATICGGAGALIYAIFAFYSISTSKGWATVGLFFLGLLFAVIFIFVCFLIGWEWTKPSRKVEIDNTLSTPDGEYRLNKDGGK